MQVVLPYVLLLVAGAAWAQTRPAAVDPGANLPALRIGPNDLICGLGL